MLYRLGGIAVVVVTLILAPNLQNTPLLLVICMALWVGFCVYLANLDRGPRAFLCQMAGFSSAVICFPYLDDPVDIYLSTVSRVEEMLVAIVCVTGVHRLFRPVDAGVLLLDRIRASLADASRWALDALVMDGAAENQVAGGVHHHRLGTDIGELGLIATRLVHEPVQVAVTPEGITRLQHLLAVMMLSASAIGKRMAVWQAMTGQDRTAMALVPSVIMDLRAIQLPGERLDRSLAPACRGRAHQLLAAADDASCCAASLLLQTADFIDTLAMARDLLRGFETGMPAPWRRPWPQAETGLFVSPASIIWPCGPDWRPPPRLSCIARSGSVWPGPVGRPPQPLRPWSPVHIRRWMIPRR